VYKAIVRARVRRGIQQLNEGNAEFVLGLAVPDFELAFPGDNSWAAMYRPVKKSRERHVTHRGVAEVRVFAQRFIAAGIQYQIDEILVNGPPWNTRVAMRAVDWVVGPDGADSYNNRMVSFLELRGARSSAGRSTRTRSESPRGTKRWPRARPSDCLCSRCCPARS
jgi:hypothetical protein